METPVHFSKFISVQMLNFSDLKKYEYYSGLLASHDNHFVLLRAQPVRVFKFILSLPLFDLSILVCEYS